MTLRRYRSTITTTGTPRIHKRIGITYLLQVGWDKPRLGRCVPLNPVITDCAISSFDVTGHHPPNSEDQIGCKKTRPAATQAELSGERRLSSLKLDPGTFGPPVSAALVFSPPILVVGSPLPIVRIDADARIWGIRISLFGSPAVALTVANHGGRARRCTNSQQTDGHQYRASKMFHRYLLEFQVMR